MASCVNLFILFSLSLFATIPFSSVAAHGSGKETHMHLYFHERNTGPNKTTTIFVPVKGTASLGFGSLGAVDEELRVGADPSSKLVGRVQGFLPVVSQQETVFLIASNFVFTEGSRYNGSTLDVFGRVVLAAETRDWTVIGGTGQFKMARGYVHGKKLSSPAGTILLELDIYVLHHGH